MPEQIVQIAADAFALGQRSQPAHFVVAEFQLRIALMLEQEVDVHEADGKADQHGTGQIQPRESE